MVFAPVLFGNKLTWPESAESNPRPFAVGPFLSEAKCWGAPLTFLASKDAVPGVYPIRQCPSGYHICSGNEVPAYAPIGSWDPKGVRKRATLIHNGSKVGVLVRHW